MIDFQPFFGFSNGDTEVVTVITLLAEPLFDVFTIDSISINFSLIITGRFGFLNATISSEFEDVPQTYPDTFPFPALTTYTFQNLTPGQTYNFEIAIKAGSDRKVIEKKVVTFPADANLISSEIHGDQSTSLELQFDGKGSSIHYEIVDSSGTVQLPHVTLDFQQTLSLTIAPQYFGMTLRIKAISGTEDGNFVEIGIGLASLDSVTFTKVTSGLQVSYVMTSDVYSGVRFELDPDPDPGDRDFAKSVNVVLDKVCCGKLVRVKVIPYYSGSDAAAYEEDVAVGPCIASSPIEVSEAELLNDKGSC